MYSFNLILSLSAAFLSVLVAALALYRDPHPLIHKIFAGGMMALAAEAVLAGWSREAVEPLAMLGWQQWRALAAAFLPALWLAFALGYGRADAQEALRRRAWFLAALLALPPTLAAFFREELFQSIPVWAPDLGWVIPLGWAGYAFNLILLGAGILILLELEKTLRGSWGVQRWQIKFTVFGLGALFGARLFTASQALLFRSLNLNLEPVNSGALILAGLLLLRSLFRTQFFSAGIYVSEKILTIFPDPAGHRDLFHRRQSAGQARRLPGTGRGVAPAGLLSAAGPGGPGGPGLFRAAAAPDQAVHQPEFSPAPDDYRNEWVRFTRATSAVGGVRDLCLAVTRLVSETLHSLAVTVWLVDEAGERLTLGGSTALDARAAEGLQRYGPAQRELIRAMTGEPDPVDFDYSSASWSINLPPLDREFLKEARIRYCVALQAGGKPIGLLTLDQRVAGDVLNLEDFNLLKVIADQTALGLSQLRLAERLQQAREMEAFQTMSTFFIHDLKNVASRLSLTMQNLPVHFDNPEFRKDALQSIGQSLNKINVMCSRLSSLREKLALDLRPTDLNALVEQTLAGFADALQVRLLRDLSPLPRVPLDPDQFSKVLTNLVLNAGEALAGAGPDGEIRVATRRIHHRVELTVSDNGPGLSPEFREKSLFQPFKTTKKQGMGIGLFQSRLIVEAHGGRIEAESEEGRGAIFRVVLPLGGK